MCKQEELHPQHSHNAGPLQGSMEQPPQQGSLQPLALSHSTPAQGLLQQPSQQTHTPALPCHPGSTPQPLCHQGGGVPLQACPGPAPTALMLSVVQRRLPASDALQQLEEEEVCCAQPALPSALPQQRQQQQLLATRDMEPSPHQAPVVGISTMLPADRSSSSGRVTAKADQAKHANKPSWHESMHTAPDADPPARVQPQDAGQGQLRGGDTATVPDKENAGAGKNDYTFIGRNSTSILATDSIQHHFSTFMPLLL